MRSAFILSLAIAAAVIVGPRAVASGTCFATLASGGGGAAHAVCLSEHGNIVQWTTPAGVEHSIKSDGYVLCSAGARGPEVHGWDAGISGEDGFGPAIVTQPNGVNTLPLTITRTSNDGVFELQQRFSKDANEKDLTVAMGVTNLSGTSRNRVMLARYFGMSPNHQNNSPNNASVTSDSVFLWDDPNQPFVNHPTMVFGVMLTALSWNVPHRATVEDHDDWNPQDSDGPQRAETCFPLDLASPMIDLLDLRGRVTYDLGTIGSGRRARVRFIYQHM